MVHRIGFILTFAGVSCATIFSIQLCSGQVPSESGTGSYGKPYDVKPESAAAIQSATQRRVQAEIDLELRAQLENTLWNDAELSIGDPGSQWWLRTRKSRLSESTWVRDWYLNERNQLPRVGSWTVKNSELLLLSPDGRIAARGQLDEFGEVHGQYYDPDKKHAFGSFHLIEQSKRLYSVVPFRVIDKNAGK